MSWYERAGLSLLHLMDPEDAHGLALKALRSGLAPGGGRVTSPRLATRLFGAEIPNPVGTAAGFDKNAEAIRGTFAAGFGFVEIGALTPRPQPGNPRPRLFRLDGDRAAINRFGFNNRGMDDALPRLEAARGLGLVGVNLGANKDSADRAGDYVTVLERLHGAADFFTVNVSSPNTERLRDLQGRAALDALLGRVVAVRDALTPRRPVALKIAPDLTEAELGDIAELALAHGLDAVVATNTTLSRAGLRSPARGEAGGLSGAPLRERAQAVMATLRRLTGGKITLIGVGGIGSAEDAYARIRAGASAVQVYTAMIYEGVTLGARIARGLDALLERDGFASVAEAVGAGE